MQHSISPKRTSFRYNLKISVFIPFLRFKEKNSGFVNASTMSLKRSIQKTITRLTEKSCFQNHIISISLLQRIYDSKGRHHILHLPNPISAWTGRDKTSISDISPWSRLLTAAQDFYVFITPSVYITTTISKSKFLVGMLLFVVRWYLFITETNNPTEKR